MTVVLFGASHSRFHQRVAKLRKITSHLALAYGDTGEKRDTFAAMLLSNDVRTARVICESLNCTHWDTYPDLYFCQTVVEETTVV